VGAIIDRFDDLEACAAALLDGRAVSAPPGAAAAGSRG
jgi:hypothetical protein